MIKRFAFLALCILLGGCLASYRNVTCVLAARETGNNIAAANYPVRVIYPYDHYGVLYVWNAPKAAEAQLDENGRVTMQISTFHSPHLVVGSTVFKLDETVIKNGGAPFKFPYRSTEEQYQRTRSLFKAYHLPSTRYPEVGVVISNPEN